PLFGPWRQRTLIRLAFGSPSSHCYNGRPGAASRVFYMGERHIIRTAILAGALLAAGCGPLVSSASAQSLTGRFKSLFGGGKSDEPAQNATPATPAAPTQDQIADNCPPVSIRAGASTYAVAAQGKEATGNDVRFQATITKTARDCRLNGGDIV